MKRILVFLSLFFLYAHTALAATRIMTVSDVHYLSPSLYDRDDPYFQKIVEESAGKAIHYSQELLEGLLAEARHQHPDILLVTGDLTFDGEAESHRDIARALHTLQEEGIRVAVIPGNHDINSMYAMSYTSDGPAWTDNVDSADFAEIWRGMTAEEMRGPGFSGVIRLNDKVWIAMGDYSVYEDHIETHGMATDAHAQWIEEVTKAAAEAGVTLVCATHQTLLKHTAYSTHTFRVHKSKLVVPIMEEAGCRLNVCGHMHVQHIMPNDEGISEIASGAWCVSPHRYGMLTIEDDGKMTYNAQSVCDAHLPNGLPEQIHAFFRKLVFKHERIELMMNGIFDQQLIDMSTFAADVNESYFAGTLHEHPEYLTDPAFAMFKKIEKSSIFGHYLTVILRERIVDALHWSSTP